MSSDGLSNERLAGACRRLQGRPGVIGVGLGLSRDAPGELVWRVYVALGDPALRPLPGRIAGRRIEIHPARRGAPASKKKTEPPVYRAGMKITTAIPASIFARVFHQEDDAQGTLGCFAREKGSGRPVLLSCSHVLFPDFIAAPSLGVFQPNYSLCCCSGERIAEPVFDPRVPATDDGYGNPIGGYRDGKWYGGFDVRTKAVRIRGAWVKGPASDVDCATARLLPGIRFHNAWPDGTPIKGIVSDVSELVAGPRFGSPVRPDQYVRAYVPRLGRVIHGTLLRWRREGAAPFEGEVPDFPDPNFVVNPWGVGDNKKGVRTNANQLLILPRAAPNERVDDLQGFRDTDSGAIVIDHRNRVIGMICRAARLDDLFKPEMIESTPELAQLASHSFLFEVGPIAVANVIGLVLDHLGIEIPAVEAGWSGTVPADGAAAFPRALPSPLLAEELARKATLARLGEAIGATREGRFWLGKIRQHAEEIRRLLAVVRALAAAWRDLQGPAYLHHVVTALGDPRHVIPDRINGVSRERLLATLLPLVLRHASPALRRDVERHGARAAAIVTGISTLDGLPAAIRRGRPGP
jgi:hypothetical protein